VARFLPLGAAEILFTYLVYVVPFSDMLRRQCLQTTATPSTFLFANPFRPHETLATLVLTKALQSLSSNVMGTPIGVKTFRQLSIAITERHVKELLKPFNRHQDRGADANPASVLAWQSGHRPFVRSNTYGLDGAFPDSLQPSLLQLYKWASQAWHDFLQLQNLSSCNMSSADAELEEVYQDSTPSPAEQKRDHVSDWIEDGVISSKRFRFSVQFDDLFEILEVSRAILCKSCLFEMYPDQLEQHLTAHHGNLTLMR